MRYQALSAHVVIFLLALPISSFVLFPGTAGAVEAGVTAALTPLSAFVNNRNPGEPTPKDQMRPMSVDSSFTIDPGHIQVEVDLAAASVAATGSGQQLEASVAPILVRFGLAKNLDLQIGVQPFQMREETLGSQRLSQSGFGDVAVRVKWNLWGNEGGESAMALQPFLKLPTATQAFGNQAIELGLTVPYDVTLPGDLSLALTSTFALNHQGEALGYMPAVAVSACVGRAVTEALAGYVEVVAEAETQEQVNRFAAVGAGLTWTLTPDLLMDASLGTAFLDDVQDINLSVSTAARF